MASAQPRAGTQFPLLEQPPEMRQTIYKYCLLDIDTICILPNAKGNVTSLHPLHRVCHQVREEFGALLAEQSPAQVTTFVADVHDMNFDSARLFFTRLSSNSPMANMRFGINKAIGEKELLISLTISKKWFKNPKNLSSLNWTSFLSKQEARGAVITPHDISYEISSLGRMNQNARAALGDCLVSRGTNWWEPLVHGLVDYFDYGTADPDEVARAERRIQKQANLDGQKEINRLKEAYGAGYVNAGAKELAIGWAGLMLVPDLPDEELHAWVDENNLEVYGWGRNR
ncbi:uncharacterized protein LTR77_001136 [Saxophila tyrrhenica]|uniref:Uncharacterized protein n=1 Tax=Saxophila tyrrhenica TaxID=1690608 RepID=A0AAV9PMR1_9PEZI|nr:hypothetical protein LTR77_001136 [Saxophila tyrrhenica]